MSATYKFNADEIYAVQYAAIGRALNKAVIDVQRALMDELSKDGTGRMYRINKSGTMHQASAAGEAPAVRTGHLRQTVAVSTVIRKNDPNMITMRLTEFAPYAAPLERGTSKMGARPWITPVLNNYKPILTPLIKSTIRRAIDRMQLKKSKKV